MGGANLIYILSDAVRSLRENIATTVLTSVTLGFSLAIFAFFAIVFANLDKAVAEFGDRTAVVAYVKDGSGEPEALKSALLKITGVKSAEFVSKEAALKELKDELKGHAAILGGIDENPLPGSFDIKIDEAHREPVKALEVINSIKALGWVEDVQYSRDWIEKFSSFLRFVEFSAAVIGLFLAAAALFIISNTIRLTVYARKEEIEIMRLVGASNAYIKAPFFIEGVLQGLFGGALALFLLWAGRFAISSKIPDYIGFVMDMPMSFLSLFFILTACGIIMGVLGSLISMARFLKV